MSSGIESVFNEGSVPFSDEEEEEEMLDSFNCLKRTGVMATVGAMGLDRGDGKGE
jgi:hypothetical protein